MILQYFISDDQRDLIKGKGPWYFYHLGRVCVITRVFTKSFRYLPMKLVDDEYIVEVIEHKKYDEISYKVEAFQSIEEVLDNQVRIKVDNIKRQRANALKTLEKYDKMLEEYAEYFM